MGGRILSASEVLEAIPHRKPFRFVDEIVEIDEQRVVARYRFREDEFFYRGHFPGNPITPGVILIETMAQAGVVAQGIYLFALEDTPEGLEKIITLFADADVEFMNIVRPGDTVLVRSQTRYFRRRKLSCDIQMTLEDGTPVCRGSLSGIGVRR